MDRSRFSSLLLALLLLAAPLAFVACAADDSEPRTRPTADSIAPVSGMTLTGNVVEIDDDAIVVRTATGNETIQLQADTVILAPIAVGDRVAVDFNRNEHGVPIAEEVRQDAAAGAR